MAISKNSTRLQITLNTDKEKEKLISEFLDGCLNPNSTVKEIIYNYIVSNFDSPLLTVTHSQSVQSEVKFLTVSNCEEQLLKASELEINELEELNKFR